MFKYLNLVCLLTTYVLTFSQEVPIMVNAKYNQNEPYNNSCPNGYATGCGPTAIAEILDYYKQPDHGYGTVPIINGVDTTYFDMTSLHFDWNEILDQYSEGNYTVTQASNIADLMYACGLSMNVDYGYSTAVRNYASMLFGLQHNLHLSADSRYLHRKNYSTAEWIEILNSQLRAGHPVFYRGTWLFNDNRSDHMFVIDGLGSNCKYHVNFGHGGKDDKYCDINVLNQSGSFPGGRGVCYNASQAMVINCYPTPDFSDYPLQSSVSEEPIVLNQDMNLSSISSPINESFTLSCRLRNCSEHKVSITYGWALIKDSSFGFRFQPAVA